MKRTNSAATIQRSNPKARKLVRERRGAMLVFIAIAMVAFFGFLALTLDVGAGNRQRRIAQTAADAGAIGGATEIYRIPINPDSVRASARNEALRNGFLTGEITVNYPPASGAYSGNNQYVEVLISKTIPSIFGSFFNISSLNVKARAVAGVGSYSLTCLYALDPSGPQAVEVENGNSITTNCGVAINSTNANALDLNASGQLNADGGGIGIVGGWTGNKPPSPTPSTGTAAVSNPLAYLQMPTVGACTATGRVNVTKDTVLNPGVYCGGISVQGKKATLNPGTYILKGGGLTVTTSGIIDGNGVTLVNTIDSTGTYAFAPFTFGNGCKATLSAPTTGSLAGILMFQDPADPANAINTFACSGDDPTQPELTGTLYFPTETLLFNGSNTLTTIDGSIVAKNIDVSAKLSIVNNATPGNALKRLSLVE